MAENRKAEKKNRILDTAIALFKMNSVSATAIDDIVKAAGIARGTFYLYFRDKSDLLEQIIMLKSRETIVDMMKKTAAVTMENELPFTDIAKQFLNNYIDFLEKNSDVLVILQKNISVVMKSAPEFGDVNANSLYSLIIEKLMEMGYSEKGAQMIVFLTVDMVGSACSDAILTGKPFTLEEIRPVVIQSALAMIENGRYAETNDNKENYNNDEKEANENENT